MQHPFASTRPLFPILERRTQLSSCSQSALALPVQAAVQRYLESWAESGMDWSGWMTEVEHAKAEFAKLINAAPSDIAVMGSVSDIASSVGSSLEFAQPRNRIVLADIDFPSVGQVWLAHARKGAAVHFVEGDNEGCVDPDAYAAKVDERTALVSVSHVSYANGFRQDLNAIAAIAHRAGALLFVDAYQSAGAVQIDVQRDPVDILATGAQKFLLGCPGIAFAYVRPDVATRLQPSNTGWFGQANPFAFDIRQHEPAPGASRFNTGTPAMVNAAAAAAAIELINATGVPAIEAWLGVLSEVAISEAGRLGLSVASPRELPRKAATTAIRVGPGSAEIERQMAARGFVVSARNDVIRIAPHFYNSEDDVVRALRALADLTQK